jgi:hypothetical protein
MIVWDRTVKSRRTPPELPPFSRQQTDRFMSSIRAFDVDYEFTIHFPRRYRLKRKES